MLKFIKTYGVKSAAVLVSVMLLCFILILSSCTKERIIVLPASTTTALTTTTTVKATTTTEEEVVLTTQEEATPEELFMELIKSDTTLTLYFTEKDLIGLAKSACAGFDNGLTKDEAIKIIFDVGQKYNLSDDQMIDLAGAVGAGVAAFCPENAYLLD
jgi:hypothetical protein